MLFGLGRLLVVKSLRPVSDILMMVLVYNVKLVFKTSVRNASWFDESVLGCEMVTEKVPFLYVLPDAINHQTR